jgi:hypothetical protein
MVNRAIEAAAGPAFEAAGNQLIEFAVVSLIFPNGRRYSVRTSRA